MVQEVLHIAEAFLGRKAFKEAAEAADIAKKESAEVTARRHGAILTYWRLSQAAGVLNYYIGGSGVAVRYGGRVTDY